MKNNAHKGKAKIIKFAKTKQPKNKIKIIDDTTMSKDLTIIPEVTEKKTRPSLYSFFRGLKKVLMRMGTDSNSDM